MATGHAAIRWLLLPSVVLADFYNNVVCSRQWYFDRRQPAPRPCPHGDFFTYYECCGPIDDCCQRIRMEPIIVLIVLVLLLIVCCCCCTLGFICRRKKKKTASEKNSLSKDEEDCQPRV